MAPRTTWKLPLLEAKTFTHEYSDAGKKLTEELGLYDYMAKLYGDGATDTEVAISIGINRHTLRIWEEMKGNAYKRFSATVKSGNEAAKVWWEKSMRGLTRGGKGSPVAAIFMMCNRWRDEYQQRTHEKVEISENISVESAAAEKLERLLLHNRGNE
jgi:hypothetical protein